MTLIDPISLTQSLVQCASVTPHDKGAQVLLKDALSSLGFIIHALPFEGRGGSYPVQNFFARLGSKAPHLCFAGHSDVVPTGDEKLWSSPPFAAEIIEGRMIGRGTSDMKGNICAFIASISQFLSQNENFKGSLSLLITGDEEAEAINGTSRVLEWMQENNHIPDVCLVGEPTNPKKLGDEIKIGRRGSLTGALTVTGKQGSVAYPHLADNPLPRLIEMLKALTNYCYDEGSEFFPATNLEITTIDVGNPAVNVIPTSGKAVFNIRFSDHWSAKTLDKKLREILDKISPKYDLKTNSTAESFITKTGDWTNLVSESVQKGTGKVAALTTNGGTSDARFISQYCPVVEFGLTNKTIHKIDENLKIKDLENLTLIYQDIISRYFQSA